MHLQNMEDKEGPMIMNRMVPKDIMYIFLYLCNNHPFFVFFRADDFVDGSILTLFAFCF